MNLLFMRSRSRRIGLLITFVMLAIAAAVVMAYRLGIPVTAAGLAAKQLCSGVFVANRPASSVIADDILPMSVVMRLAQMQVDERARTVTASLPDTGDRHAVYRGRLGCVLLAQGSLPNPVGLHEIGFDRQAPASGAQPGPDSNTVHGFGTKKNPGPMRGESTVTDTSGPADLPWPEGIRALAPESWPSSVDRDALQSAVTQAFAASGSSSTSPSYDDSRRARTRGVVVVKNGSLLTERYAAGFDADTPQLGWSMAKTVLSVLTWMRFSEQQIPLTTPLGAAMTRVPKPHWVGDWQRDSRARITVDDLLTMHDGLNHHDDTMPWSDLPHMLWSEPDIAAWAGRAPIQTAPGTDWRYASAVSNLLSRALRDQFASDLAYWQYPWRALFDRIGMTSAVLETDADGTFVGSSYAWATPRDWARLGLLLLNDGRWSGEQIFPAGWLAYARKPRFDAKQERVPFGAHVWQTHDMNGIDCPGSTRLPDDGLLLLGHWGQVVGVFPSQNAVIVRLGWTSDEPAWDRCRFLATTLAALGNR